MNQKYIDTSNEAMLNTVLNEQKNSL